MQEGGFVAAAAVVLKPNRSRNLEQNRGQGETEAFGGESLAEA